MKVQQKSIEQLIEDLRESKKLGQLLLDNADSFTLSDLNKEISFSILYRKVSVQTARRDMKKLLDSKLLTKDEEGKYTLNLMILG